MQNVGVINAFSLPFLSCLLEIPVLLSLAFKILNYKEGKGDAELSFKHTHCHGSTLNINVGKLKPNETPEYLESTTKSLGSFLLPLSEQVICCVCLSFPNVACR